MFRNFALRGGFETEAQPRGRFGAAFPPMRAFSFITRHPCRSGCTSLTSYGRNRSPREKYDLGRSTGTSTRPMSASPIASFAISTASRACGKLILPIWTPTRLQDPGNTAVQNDQLLLRGGHHPELGLQFYVDTFRAIKEEFPTINCMRRTSRSSTYHQAGRQPPTREVLQKLKGGRA